MQFFEVRSQGDACTYDVKKVMCGLKYVSSCFTGDVNYDVVSQKFDTSGVVAVCPLASFHRRKTTS